MRTAHLLPWIFLAACGGGTQQTMVDARAVVDTPPAVDAPPDGPDPRGPMTVDLAGGANSVLWDAASSTLYLTDNNANTLVRWTDAGGLQTVGTFPAGPAGVNLGDLIRRGDGTIVATSFGYGTAGTLFGMSGSTSFAYTGLATARRRIGLSQDVNGTIYVAYFTGGGGNPQVGGVSLVTLAGTTAVETEIAGASTNAGFKKVVGVVATPAAVFVGDQTDKIIYKISIPEHEVTTVATKVPSVDLLAILPNGDLLTGGTAIHRVTQAGVSSTIVTGLDGSVHGIAYDAARARVFFIEHSTTVGTPDRLHVRPLD